MLLRNGASDAKDQLKWKMTRGGPSIPADVVRDGVALALCVYDASSVVLAATIPTTGLCAGKPCWKPLGGSGARYKNKTGAPNGIIDVKLQASGAGELGVIMKGKGGALALPTPLGVALPVRIQLVAADGDATTCWESSFPTAAKNDATQLKANGS